MNDYRQARGDEKVRQVMDWIKKGRMTIGGFYCSVNTDFMSLETLHRSVYYTTEILSRNSAFVWKAPFWTTRMASPFACRK